MAGYRQFTPLIDLAELSTILAALRYYQERGQAHAPNRSEELDELATCGGDVMALDSEDINELCQHLNTQPVFPEGALGWILAEAVQVEDDRLQNLSGAEARAELDAWDRVLAWGRAVRLPHGDLTEIDGALPNDKARAEIAERKVSSAVIAGRRQYQGRHVIEVVSQTAHSEALVAWLPVDLVASVQHARDAAQAWIAQHPAELGTVYAVREVNAPADAEEEPELGTLPLDGETLAKVYGDPED